MMPLPPYIGQKEVDVKAERGSWSDQPSVGA